MVRESLVRQSINSLNSSIFVGGNDLPANLFSNAQEEEPPKTNRKADENNISSFLNDVSPIAHHLDASDYKNTKFTNILDSNARSEAVSASDINVEILEADPSHG